MAVASSSRLVGVAAAGAVAGALLCKDWQVATVAGQSMQPTLNKNKAAKDQVIVDRSMHTARNASRGDIVVLPSPTNSELITKRLIGDERDWLYSRQGKLVRVPTSHVWVEGDNAGNSNDSNSFGAVPRSALQGKVVAKVWPLSEANVFTPTIDFARFLSPPRP